jgi:hypothetical protein
MNWTVLKSTNGQLIHEVFDILGHKGKTRRVLVISIIMKTNVIRNTGEKEPSFTAGGIQISVATTEMNMEIPQETKIELSYDPALPLLDIYPKECKPHAIAISTNPCSLQHYSR